MPTHPALPCDCLHAAAPHARPFPWLPVLPVFLALAWAAWLPSPASAQVLRCLDPATGQMTYTDGSCPKGQGVTEIAPARSAQELAQDQERAQAARERWQAEQLRQKQAAAQTAPALPTPTPAERRSQACQAAQQELQALSRSPSTSPVALDAAQRQMEMQCLGPDAYASLERSRANALAPGETTVVLPHHQRPPMQPRPPRPQEPIQRLNCNVFRCFDQHGNAMPAPRPGEVR